MFVIVNLLLAIKNYSRLHFLVYIKHDIILIIVSEHENKIESVQWILYQSTLNITHAKISCFIEYKSLVGYKTKFLKDVDDPLSPEA